MSTSPGPLPCVGLLRYRTTVGSQFGRYLTRSGLTAVAIIVSVGAVNLFYALRNHERGEALGVAVIFFIIMPALALWPRRLSSTGKAQ
jgi:hypothetical protein